MKNFLTLALVFLSFFVATASTPPNTTSKDTKIYASEVFITINKDGTKISLLELSRISKTDLETMTGRKMSHWDKKAFFSAQKKMKKGINSEGVVTNKKLAKYFDFDGETGFHLGGFALGLLLSLVGVLIAYLIDDSKKPNRTKWAWIGFVITAVLFGLTLI